MSKDYKKKAVNLSFDSNLRKKLAALFIVSSSTAEGITLGKKEVEEIVNLDKNASVLSKKQNTSVLQAFAQKQVLDLIEKWAKAKSDITVAHLIEIHRVFWGMVDKEAAGRFRRAQVKLKGSNLLPTPYFAISADINDFNNWLVEKQRNLEKDDVGEIINLVARSYHTITKIHPFEDGNGRSARLFIALILRKYGLPYLIIPKVTKVYEMRFVLRKADMGNFKPLIKYFERLMVDSFRKLKSTRSTHSVV